MFLSLYHIRIMIDYLGVIFQTLVSYTVSALILLQSWLLRHFGANLNTTALFCPKVPFLGLFYPFLGKISSKIWIQRHLKPLPHDRTAPLYLRRYGICLWAKLVLNAAFKPYFLNLPLNTYFKSVNKNQSKGPCYEIKIHTYWFCILLYEVKDFHRRLLLLDVIWW